MSPEPPRWASWMIAAAAPSRERSTIEGDLAEGFRRRVDSMGSSRARQWYARQVLQSLGPLSLSSLAGPAAWRFMIGAFLGIGVTSFVPFLVDRWLRPALSGQGIAPMIWFVSVAVVTALAGGYVAVRIARVRAVTPILALVWLFYAPSVFHLARHPQRLAAEGAWLLLAAATATAAAALARHRVTPLR